jgi:hypothetical protein
LEEGVGRIEERRGRGKREEGGGKREGGKRDRLKKQRGTREGEGIFFTLSR